MSFFRPEIEQMPGYTPGEQPQGGKFIKLNTNENPYPHSPDVVAAIQVALEQGLARYPDPMGSAFRAAAADVYGFDKEWILCGNGSDDILTIITRSIVGTDERILVPYPSYLLYQTLADIQGGNIEWIRFTDEWQLPDDFAARADQAKIVYLPNPNSPTGTVVANEQISAMASATNTPILIDEAYADFAESDCLGLVREHANVMVCRTLSKSYALAGLRFGFLIANPELMGQFVKVKDSYNCDSLSIAGATAAITDQKWFVETRDKIIRTRQRLQSQLEQLGFSVIPSQANFVWCTHSEQPAATLFDQLRQNRILVRYMKYPDWSEGLRISVGTDEQNDALIAVLETAVAK